MHRDLIGIYRAVFSLPPYHETEDEVAAFAQRVLDDAAQPGFRCCIARAAPDGPVLGFAYGTPWRSGSAWHRCLGAVCGRALLTDWLGPSFVLTELAVLPAAQRGGLGRRLHDTLLARLPQPTAVLTTPQVEMPANQLYLSAGWRVLRLDFQCEHMDRPYLVMGLDLRTER